MSEKLIQEEIDRFHKFFGSEANNRCWSLTEQKERSQAEIDEMLDLAHSAAFHWCPIGTELNNMRATMLLGQAYAQADQGELAMRYAQRSFDYFTDPATTDVPDWEIAFAHAVLANAKRTAGLTNEVQITAA